MSDSFNAKIYRPNGDELHLADGASIIIDASSTPITLTNTGGELVFSNVPTSDPQVAGALWANNNVLTLSAGA